MEKDNYELDIDTEKRIIFKKQDNIDNEYKAKNNKQLNYINDRKIIDEDTANIKIKTITKEVEKSFLDYAMSVIVSRALPDARDGLKPVHRRILYDMFELGITSGSQHRKSARIVGDVLGKYHPHGDTSVYDAMVRMAQDFSIRYPLVDGQGNFGSMDGDEAAAMRYTEARMTKLAQEMLDSIKKETVIFKDNYDATEKEPTVLPSRLPNLLINGSSGIAVGMATEIPSHNLSDTIDTITKYINNTNVSDEELFETIKAPDFATGGVILNKRGLMDAYKTGRGSITIRSKYHIETKNGKNLIVFTEIPYTVKKPSIIQKVHELMKENKLEGINSIKDETSSKGVRLVVDVKRGQDVNILVNNLFKKTQLQINYSINMVALVNGEPKTLSLRELIDVYVNHQLVIIENKSKFDLSKLDAKLNILNGYKLAVGNIDKVIAIIKSSKTDQDALEKLVAQLSVNEIQAKYILDMPLKRLNSLNVDVLNNDINETLQGIKTLKEILSSKENLIKKLLEELSEIKDKFGDKRRSSFDWDAQVALDDKDLIKQEDVVITCSKNGFIKRMPIDEFKVQKRGGVGVIGSKTYDDDYNAHMLIANTHENVLIFTSSNKVYSIAGFMIPEFAKSSKGTSINNILKDASLDENETIVSMIKYDNNYKYLLTITKKGIVKKTLLKHYENIRKTGIKGFNLQDDDSLVDVILANDGEIISIANKNNKVVMCNIDEFKTLGRNAIGVKGIKLDKTEEVLSISSSSKGDMVLSVGSKGTAKITPMNEFRQSKRGAKGVKGINSEKAGDLIFNAFVGVENEIMILTKQGQIIKVKVSDLSISSRNTKGVKLIELREKDSILKVEIV